MNDDAFDEHYRNERDFQLILSRIRSQDPTLKSIKFLNNPSTDNDAAAATLGDVLLESASSTVGEEQRTGTKFAKTLDISIHQLSAAGNYDSLLQWIESSTRLQTLHLDGHGDFTQPPTPPQVTARFLQAVQRSTSIQKLDIGGCFSIPAAVMIDFLQGNRSVTNLELDCATFDDNNDNDMDDLERQQSVAAAFCHNTTLQRLYLEILDETRPFVVSIVRALSANQTLQHLVLEESGALNDPHTFDSIQRLLHQSQTLRNLELQYFSFQFDNDATNADNHNHNHNHNHSIIRALHANSSLHTLTLKCCQLSLQQARALTLAVANNSSMQHLRLLRSTLDSQGTPDRTVEQLTTLVQACSNLTSLQLDVFPLREESVPFIEPFVQACSQSPKLTHLTVKNALFFYAIVAALPHARHWTVLKLRFPNDGQNEAEAAVLGPVAQLARHEGTTAAVRRQALLDGLKRNTSVLECKVLPRRAIARRDLNRYVERNRAIQAWRALPVSLDDEYTMPLPRVFAQISPCELGPAWIFKTVSILSEAVENES